MPSSSRVTDSWIHACLAASPFRRRPTTFTLPNVSSVKGPTSTWSPILMLPVRTTPPTIGPASATKNTSDTPISNGTGMAPAPAAAGRAPALVAAAMAPPPSAPSAGAAAAALPAAASPALSALKRAGTSQRVSLGSSTPTKPIMARSSSIPSLVTLDVHRNGVALPQTSSSIATAASRGSATAMGGGSPAAEHTAPTVSSVAFAASRGHVSHFETTATNGILRAAATPMSSFAYAPTPAVADTTITARSGSRPMMPPRVVL
mmetsp:Transcript_10447/g.26819  ORF Transcript_10447/g.26819 Transcript_10447/m.26819 type:complete len:262 (-) Transcript_10447:1156-1941(-)